MGPPLHVRTNLTFLLIKSNPVGKVTSSVFHLHCPVRDRFIVPGTQRGFRVCFVHTTASGDTEMCQATVVTLICVVCVWHMWPTFSNVMILLLLLRPDKAALTALSGPAVEPAQPGSVAHTLSFLYSLMALGKVSSVFPDFFSCELISRSQQRVLEEGTTCCSLLILS